MAINENSQPRKYIYMYKDDNVNSGGLNLMKNLGTGTDNYDYNVYFWDTEAKACIFAEDNKWTNQTGDMDVSSQPDFVLITGSSNEYKNGWYESETSINPVFHGCWDGSNWEDASLTYNSSTKRYKTETKTYSNPVEFGFKLLRNNNQVLWASYNNQTMTQNGQKATFSNANNNSNIKLNPKDKFHLEIDFKTMDIYLIIDEYGVPDPVLTFSSASVASKSSNSATINYSYKAENFASGMWFDVTYSVNGSTVTAESSQNTQVTNGSFTINSLSPGTYYSVVVKVTPRTNTSYAQQQTVTFTTDNVTIGAPVITIKDHTNPDINGKARGAKYFIATIAQNSTNPGNIIYYTTDGTTPTTSSKLYTGEFQVSGKSTIKAIAAKDGSISSVTTVNHQASNTFGWEDPDALEQLKKFRISIEADPSYKGVSAKLEIKFEDHDGAASYGGEEDSAYSWAKYEDFGAYEKYVAENDSKTDYSIDEATDHLDTPGAEQAGFIDLANNDTEIHYARNFTPAYYRAYVHSDVVPNPVNPSGQNKIRTYAADDSQSSWTKNENSAAGNIDPYAAARIAYTVEVNPDDSSTTGVEDVITDGAIDNSDDANAPVIYYNLQGVRVENPANGVYIRVQGNKSEKVMLH